MSHFAKVKDGVVQAVIVAEQSFIDSLPTEDGVTWVQTSYNSNIRGNFAHIGGTYDSSLDKFQEPKPFDSWTWDDTKNEYVAPLPHPLADIDPNDESAQPDYITSKPDDEIWLHRWNETAYQADNTTGWEFVQWTQADEDALQGQNLGD